MVPVNYFETYITAPNGGSRYRYEIATKNYISRDGLILNKLGVNCFRLTRPYIVFLNECSHKKSPSEI